jgi:hypothetical protein
LAFSVAGRLAERRDQRAEQRQDQHPQQHRAFVVAPGAGELVDGRHPRMRVFIDIRDREIGRQVAGRQRRERRRDEEKLHQRR